MHSIIPQYTYFCDNCNEMAVINKTDYYEKYDILICNINDVRKVLINEGWSFWDKDLCPECTALLQNKKK